MHKEKSQTLRVKAGFHTRFNLFFSFILATFRDLLIKGGFWMLYDGENVAHTTTHNKNAGSWDEAAGCTLGEPGRKSHQPNHRKLITADKMAAATKTGAGESSVRTGKSQQGATLRPWRPLSAHRLNKRWTKWTMSIINMKYVHPYAYTSSLMSIVSGTFAAGILLLYYYFA